MRARTDFDDGNNRRSSSPSPLPGEPGTCHRAPGRARPRKENRGISDLRNESSREGMRLVIELKRDAVPQVVLNHLYAQTSLQVSFGVIMLAIVDGRSVLNLRDAFLHYLDHRRRW